MHAGQRDDRPREVRPVRMPQPVLRRNPIAHGRLPAHVQHRHDLQVVAAHEGRSAADDFVQVDVKVGDPTRGSGRVCVGGVAVASTVPDVQKE